MVRRALAVVLLVMVAGMYFMPSARNGNIPNARDSHTPGRIPSGIPVSPSSTEKLADKPGGFRVPCLTPPPTNKNHPSQRCTDGITTTPSDFCMFVAFILLPPPQPVEMVSFPVTVPVETS